jgi:FtsP/CotA-like multicopper oxidase with cupredoxin domain
MHTGNESFTTPRNGVNSVAFNIDTEFVIQTEGIQTIDILIENFDDGNHPMHLHGYKYFVLGQGKGYFPRDTYGRLDTTNPLRRDTASVMAFGWLLIRVVFDNPGMWAFHCKFMTHAEAVFY